ncbi:MAG TPA: serine/threonine-protein kinase [Steroidobacteraceae bacterium]|jgi:serine/threonine-protein kinase|nr:serine/threonine-protein kinase [Steroidobacteraceae bacterium]
MAVMSDERWRTLSDWLDQALEKTQPERADWLAGLKINDPDMAAELAVLLAARECEEFGQFLEGAAPLPVGDMESATLIGRSVGRYVIDAELGRGGMGSVWRAHRADGRYQGVVAIKFVNAMWIGQSGEQRFHVEGSVLARLNHPNIARLLDAGVLEGSQPYLILEYVEGEAIDAYCNRNELTVKERVDLFLSVLQAVAHAHSNLIVHRDLKPGNVFVARDGTVKLLDFGIAKLLDGDPASPSLTRVNGLAMTPQYAAPEQLLGQAITTATDVYALGLLLYLLLTGVDPISAKSKSSADLVHAVLTMEPPRASTVASLPVIRNRSLSGDLDNVLHKAIKKNPAERYVSADAFADDLRRFLADKPIDARPDSVGYRTGKFVRRHRVGTALASIAAIVLTASLLVIAAQTRRATRAAQHAVAERMRADESAKQAREERDMALEGVAQAQDLTELTAFLLGEALPEDRPKFTAQVLLRGLAVVRDSKGVPLKRRAQMMEVIGGQFEDRRDYEQASKLFAEALDVAERSGDAGASSRASCHLGMLEAYMGHAPEGLLRINRALDRLPHDTGSADPRIVCYLSKGTAMPFIGQSGLAEVEMAEKTLPDLLVPSPYFEQAIQAMLSASYARAMRVPDAQRAYAREQQLADEAGRGHERPAWVHFLNQGTFLWKIGRPLDARESMRRAQVIDRERGTSNRVEPMALVLAARIALQLGDAGGAIAGFADALRHAQQSHDFPAEAVAAGERITALRQGGSFARVQRLLPATVSWLHTQYPPSHWTFAVLRMEAALVAEHNGDALGARKLADEAVKHFEDNSTEVYQFPIVLLERAGIEQRRSDIDAAHIDAARALKIYARTFGPDIKSACIGDALMMMGRLSAARGEAAAAREFFAKAASHFEASIGGDNPKTRMARELAQS